MYGDFSGIPKALSDYKTSPVYNMKDWGQFFYPAANAFKRFSSRGGEQEQLYNQFKDSYLAGTPEAKANAKVYQDYTRNLFTNQPSQFDLYKNIGDYLYGNLNQFGDRIGQSGTAELNSRFAQLGLSPTRDLAAQRAVANRITNNLAPVFANTTNAIGRDYNALNAGDLQQTALRLGLANQDALNQYMDRIYERPLDVSATRSGEIAGNINQFGNLMDAYKKNIAGFETKQTNDLARYIEPLTTWASSYGGGSGALQTTPYQQQFNPYQQQIAQNPYQMPMSAPQNTQWMNEFYGNNPYQYNYGNQSAPMGDFGSSAATMYSA